MHLVVSRIKDAWCSGNITIALSLDIQGAFSNMVRQCFIHNIRNLGVPTGFVHLTECMLSNWCSWLRFDNFLSDWIPISNRTIQGCPLSMLFYSFYNAPFISTACPGSQSKLASSFVDNVMFLAIAKSLMETHAIVKNVMECADGTFDWSILHNSPFEFSKLALIDFPHLNHDISLPDLALQHRNLNGTHMVQVVTSITNQVPGCHL